VRTVDLIDETYLRAPIDRVAAVVHDEARWSLWWPQLRPVVVEDRGTAGIRWDVTGALVGNMEIWLEPCELPLGGAVLHYYLRADPPVTGSSTEAAPLTGRAATAERARWARTTKQAFWSLKDELEAGFRREGGSISEAARRQ